MKDAKTRGIFCAVAGALCWGFSGTCCQFLFQNYEIDTVWLSALRLVAGGLILLAAELVRKKGGIFDIFKSWKELLKILCIGIFGLLFCQYSYLAAIRYLDSGTATILQTLNVIMILVAVSLYTRKFPAKMQLAAIVLALAGVVLIVTDGDLSSMSLSGTGLLWGLGAALGAAFYSVMSPPSVKKWGSQIVSGYGMLFGGIVLVFGTGTWKTMPVLDGKEVLVLAVVVLVGTVGGFALFLQGISVIGPEKASLIGCLEPVAATISAYFWMHSEFGAVKLAGFALVLAAVCLSNGKRQGTPKESW